MESGVETQTCAALRQEIERSLRRAFDPADVLPRLARLARLAPAASDDGVFAHRQLAELLVERHPWRAAIYARRALAHRSDDDRAWAVLAFCQTLLGNFRCAATAYQQAIASAPANPWYAHNLGHLLDVALGAPHRALPWLRSAYGKKADNSEIVASYVHALARAGHTAEARGVLERALERFDSRELQALLRWLDQGAPSRGAGAPRTAAGAKRALDQAHAKRDGEKRERAVNDRQLARALERGLSHLPLDSRQRERALVLARDVLADAARIHAESVASAEAAASAELVANAVAAAGAAKNGKKDARKKPAPPLAAAPSRRCADEGASSARAKRKPEDVAGLAAAVAYAIVYVDHVPLSQAEVAAPFRVAVGRLRGRFAELRAKLDIIPGDARYATTRGC
jgi:tetratricopeptide (TPR) repeat protein